MSNEEKIMMFDRLSEMIKEVNIDLPVMVGTLKSKQGIKGFEVADIGHPVFEVDGKYVIYLKSESELTERICDQKSQQIKTKVGFFIVTIPYYKQSLSSEINFINKNND